MCLLGDRDSGGRRTGGPQLATLGLCPRELTLKKGDIVYIHKEVDRNWLEGEHHGRLGIFPANYVEVSCRAFGGQTLVLETPLSISAASHPNPGPGSQSPSALGPGLAWAGQCCTYLYSGNTCHARAKGAPCSSAWSGPPVSRSQKLSLGRAQLAGLSTVCDCGLSYPFTLKEQLPIFSSVQRSRGK